MAGGIAAPWSVENGDRECNCLREMSRVMEVMEVRSKNQERMRRLYFKLRLFRSHFGGDIFPHGLAFRCVNARHSFDVAFQAGEIK
ncbi:MAG: hypothetical protein ACOY3V_01865 [Pseudomonadota bacterium]